MKFVTKIRPDLQSIVRYCQTFAESAESEYSSKPEYDDSQSRSLYKDSVALGLICVAQNILNSLQITGMPKEFEPLTKAFEEMDGIEIPIRLQDLANYYGQCECDEIVIAYDRIADVILRLIDLSLCIWKKIITRYENAAEMLVFYNTSAFQENFKKHLEAKLIEIRNDMIPNLTLSKVGNIAKNCTFTGTYPIEKVKKIQQLVKIKKPLWFSNEYASLDIWMSDKHINFYAKGLSETMKELKKSAIPRLKACYSCSPYCPKNFGSKLQVMTKNEILKIFVGANMHNSEAFLGTTLNSDTPNFLIDEGMSELAEKLRKTVVQENTKSIKKVYQQ